MRFVQTPIKSVNASDSGSRHVRKKDSLKSLGYCLNLAHICSLADRLTGQSSWQRRFAASEMVTSVFDIFQSAVVNRRKLMQCILIVH